MLKKFAFITASAVCLCGYSSTVGWTELVRSIPVLYAEVDQNAEVSVNNQFIPLRQYLGSSLVDAAVRIRLVEQNAYLFFYVGDGQMEDSADGIGLITWVKEDDVYVPTDVFGQYTQYDISGVLDDDHIVMELVLYPDNDEDPMIYLGETEEYSIGYMKYAGHTYNTFDLNPPSANPWMASVFYIPVPEPSTSFLCIIGVYTLLLRRKHATQL